MATILVAGGTGNLGKKIVGELIKNKATVKAIIRAGAKQEDISLLQDMGAAIITLEFSQAAALIAACRDVSCVVSAMAGTHETIVAAQSQLLKAALGAGTPRFIPSDYSVDFTGLPQGDNRNFDLRKQFHEILDRSPIAATSVFNGAFTDILAYNTPVYDTKNNSVAYWGDNAGWKLDFTTMANTAAFTAKAALDENTPRYLRIASFQVSPRDLQELGEKLKQHPFALKPMGSLDDFAAYNKQQRAADPAGEKELYPKWQNSQYLHSMFSAHNEKLDNERYRGIEWTNAEQVLANI